jgi:RNA polymerase sigma factor (sigma-70 family)
MKYKTGIHDIDIVNDVIQEFYVRLIKSRTLEEYDEERESDFNTWVCNVLGWVLPLMKRRNFRNRFEVHSTVDTERSGIPEKTDVFELIDADKRSGTHYKVDHTFSTDMVEQLEIDEEQRKLESFLRYVRKTEPRGRADQIEQYVRCRLDGMTSVEIADMMSTSNSTLHVLKETLRKKMKRWENRVWA